LEEIIRTCGYCKTKTTGFYICRNCLDLYKKEIDPRITINTWKVNKHKEKLWEIRGETGYHFRGSKVGEI
jgi:hypothetical protein